VQAAPEPFGRQDFSRITFSGHCHQQQWSRTPDNTLSLALSATPDGPCSVELFFNDVLDVTKRSALTFETRATVDQQPIAVGISENEEDAARISQYLAPRDWQSDGLRLAHIQDGWSPTKLARLSFSVFPPAQGNKPAILFVRNIRFVPGPFASRGEAVSSKPAAPPSPASEEPIIVQMDEPAVVRVTPVPTDNHRLSRLVTRFYPIHITRSAAMALSAGAVWVTGAFWILSRRRRLPLPHLSPLYEMNCRTWKSQRDTEGVLHIGGFNKITLADLKAIKTDGFSSIWFMGIWEIGAKVRHISRRYGNDYAGSPFAISDYRVSEELGTEEDFLQLIDRAHAAGLKVILDFVPNHMGLDSVWLNDHPEYFIHQTLSTEEAQLPDSDLECRYPGYFVYRTPFYPQGNTRAPRTIMVAYGKDPYFYPWIDTAQLDYAQPSLRRRMIDVLSQWAKVADGVRCDMAMLVLREQIKVHRHPEMNWDTFNRLMPEEFWTEAIRRVKRINPSFVFIAETYWSMEGHLQHLGFDYTYNKPLYEAMCHTFHSGHAEGLLNFLRVLGTDFLKKGVHFLENHDEERAMNILGEDRQRAAATMLSTLPGIALIHQGQMEGKRERLPVQRVVPLHQEAVNTKLQSFYSRLLEVTSLPVFRNGRLHVLYSNNPAFVTYTRTNDEMQALVVINSSNRYQKGSVFLNPGLKLKTGAPYKLYDLFYELKTLDVRRHPSIQPSYCYPAAALINQGLYVELNAHDAHIFLFEPRTSYKAKEKFHQLLRGLNQEWPLPRVARRLLGPALIRSTDQALHEATSPENR
jgi:glycosidase